MYIGEGNTPDGCRRVWQPPPPDEATNLAAWHFNSVRLHISWANLEPTPPTIDPRTGDLMHHWNETYLNAVAAAIDGFRERGIATIAVFTQAALSPAFKKYDPAHIVCEGSGMPSWLYPNASAETYPNGWCALYADRSETGVPIRPQEGLADAERAFAARFANDPGLAAVDIINEPNTFRTDGCHGKAIGLPRLYEKLGRSIRAVDPNVILVFEDTNAFRTLGTGLDEAPALSNAMFSLHTYQNDWAATQEDIDLARAQAKRWNVPLWIGEFDAFDRTTRQSKTALIEILRRGT